MGSSGSPAERLLDASLLRFVEQIPAIVYVETDEQPFPTTYVSRRIETILGFPPERFLRGPEAWTPLVHPDDLEAVRHIDRRCADTHEPYVAEYRLLDREGRYHWFHDEAVYVRAEGGVPGCWQGVMFDVTDQKRVEHELRETAARFKTLVEQIPAVVYIEGDNGSADSPYFISSRYQELFGYTPEERLADPDLWSRILHPEDRERAIEAAERAARTGAPFHMEYRMIARDGRVVWVQDETVLVRDEGGAPLFWQGVLFDITERKQAEEDARGSATKFQTLVEQIPAVVYMDPVETEPVRSLYVSPQIEAMLGVPPEVAMQDDDWWINLIHPDDRDRTMEASDRADETGAPFRYEYRMVAADGRVVWVRDEAILIQDPDGTPLYWQGVIHDITDQKRAEADLTHALGMERLAVERLQEADDIKNTFLTAVSHDLRTPLAAILGTAVTLENEDRLRMTPDERRDMIHGLAEKARRLTVLVTDLLDMDRLSRGALEPRLALVEIDAIVSRVTEETDALASRVVHLDLQPAAAEVDVTMVERIVENLLVNAGKHTPSDATIWVRTAADAGGVLLTVEDDGPGVPPELSEVLFRPFERGPSASDHAPGVGLGLSLVARFAQLHGGRAWVEERPGGGASFKVLLPPRPSARRPDPRTARSVQRRVRGHQA